MVGVWWESGDSFGGPGRRKVGLWVWWVVQWRRRDGRRDSTRPHRALLQQCTLSSSTLAWALTSLLTEPTLTPFSSLTHKATFDMIGYQWRD